MTISIPEEYAELMKHNRDGHYLYTPQRFSQLHPGAVGFFDKDGDWNLITDLSIPGRPEENGFTAPRKVVTYETPKEKIWKTTSSSKEAEASFGLTGGLSGALSSAPIDVSAEAKNKWGKTGKAALITDENVIVNEWLKAPCRDIITEWVEKNAKELVKGEWGSDIKDYGLWAIKKTWSTQECAIKMTSAHSRDTSGGFDVGATGIAKVGTNGSSTSKTNNEGWRTYKATEDDKGLVVSYGGAAFKLHKVQMFHRNPLKQTEKAFESISAPVEYAKPVYDEDGNQIGEEYFRPVFDENNQVVGEEKIDREAERKAREEKAKRLQEELQKRQEEQGQLEDEIVIQAGDVVGEDDDEAEAEEEAVRALAEQRKVFKEQVMRISENPDLTEEQKKRGLAALLAATATETTETVPLSTTETTAT